MGMHKKSSNCSHPYWDKEEELPRLPPNNTSPDPSHYTITFIHTVGKYVIVQIHYPDCTNFEGKKILVYKDVDSVKLLGAKHLDPHFCDSEDCLSPIARFVPTPEGLRMAVVFVNALCAEETNPETTKKISDFGARSAWSDKEIIEKYVGPSYPVFERPTPDKDKSDSEILGFGL